MISVDLRRLPWFRRLAVDYALDFQKVAPFFAGDPADRRAWAEAITRTQAHPRQREGLAAILAAQQDRRQAPPGAREAARRLADPRTVAVVTGQQAGLFGGPLFTLFKALTAIKLAEQVSREHSVPAVAVFWIDAEDHDWEEVRSCTVFDEALLPHTVALAARPGAAPRPVAAVQVDDSILEVLSELERILPPTEFRSSLLDGLRRAYAPGTGMAEAFGRWMETVLGHRGLWPTTRRTRQRRNSSAHSSRARSRWRVGPHNWRRWPAPTSRHAATTRRCTRTTPNRHCFASATAAGTPSASTRAASSSGTVSMSRLRSLRRPTIALRRSAPTCYCGRWSRMPCSRTICDVAGPNELAILANCEAWTSTWAFQCR